MSTKKQEQAEEHNFLQRWSRRKQAQLTEQDNPPPSTNTFPTADAVETALPATKTEEAPKQEKPVELPDVASLDANSDYTGFLNKEVDRQVRKVALRTLFKQTQFNAVDDLDIYHEDYTDFEPLGDIVTHDMRHMMEVEKRREEEKARQAAETEEQNVDTEETQEAPPSTDTAAIKEENTGDKEDKLVCREESEKIEISTLSTEQQESEVKNN